MSKIDDLIKKLCLNGVTHCRLGDVIQLKKGKQLNKNFLNEKGQYPAYNGGITFSGYTDTYNYNENKIIISQGGASAGFVNFVKTKFYANAHCYVILPNEEVIINKYVFHFLKLNQKKLTEKQHGAGIPALSTREILEMSIPVPPLLIQNEIVNILDAFTTLETELEVELEARKKQYIFHRNRLFSFEGQDVEWKTLEELGEFTRGKRFVKTDIQSEGVPCIHYGEMYTHYKISAKEAKSYLIPTLASKLRKAKYGDVIIVAAGETIEDIGQGVAWLGDKEVVIHDACFAFSHNMHPNYVSHFTQTDIFHSQIKRYISSGKISSINAAGLSKAKIPFPSMEEQIRIASILDKFHTLLNDILIGLPAEIKARNKQYEYYRNQLLTFKQLNNE
jgi:type I restriction enzyme S subunit